MGDEKYAKLEEGLAKYISEEKKNESTLEVFEALDVLSSLVDFIIFKKVMLAKKAEIAGGTGGL